MASLKWAEPSASGMVQATSPWGATLTGSAGGTPVGPPPEDPPSKLFRHLGFAIAVPAALVFLPLVLVAVPLDLVYLSQLKAHQERMGLETKKTEREMVGLVVVSFLLGLIFIIMFAMALI